MILYILVLWIIYWENNIPKEATLYDPIFTIVYYTLLIYLTRKYFLDLKNTLEKI